MKDRFTLGFVTGIIGSVPLNAMSLFNYHVTHFVKLRYLDFAGYMIFGRLPGSLPELILSQIVQIGFSGMLGALFAYFLVWVNKENYLFKGLIWGNGSWFIIYSITVLFKVPIISKPTFGTAMWEFISTSVYGVTLAFALAWAEKRLVTDNMRPAKKTPLKYRILIAPARKIEHEGKMIKVKKPIKTK